MTPADHIRALTALLLPTGTPAQKSELERRLHECGEDYTTLIAWQRATQADEARARVRAVAW